MKENECENTYIDLCSSQGGEGSNTFWVVQIYGSDRLHVLADFL